jgi:hypothetical protein
MQSIKHITLEITISRAAAILAGKSQFGKIETPVDPALLTPEQREELAKHMTPWGSDGVHSGKYSPITPIAEISTEAISRYIDEHRQQRLASEAATRKQDAERDVEHVATATEWLETPDEELIRWARYGNEVHGPHGYQIMEALERARPDLASAVVKRLAALQETAKAKDKVDNAAREAREAKDKAAYKALEKRKADGLAAFVAAHCTDVQKARRTADLMPNKEVLALVRDSVFAPLDQQPRYERMRASDYGYQDEETVVEFDTRDAKAATDDQFVAMEAIRKLLPGATVTLREHVATIGDEEMEVKPTFHVAIDWHGHELTREYAA